MSGPGGAVYARLGPDRWHFQHGPIDLIIDVESHGDSGARAIAECWRRFAAVLPGLVEELPELRRPLGGATHASAALEGAPLKSAALGARPALRGPVARRMLIACAPFAEERFITPMAAVAGAVADELIGSFAEAGITRACINNGGDIALLLAPGASYRVGICSQPVGVGASAPGGVAAVSGMASAREVPLSSIFTVRDDSPVRGIATSGWRGRSFSLGIADSVTVLAADAAAADAAATLIANAVNCDFPGIGRRPADELKDDTDLGSLLVTVDVPPLPAAAIAGALASGRAEAARWQARGLIHAAAMFLQGEAELLPPRQPRVGGAVMARSDAPVAPAALETAAA